MLGVEIPHHFNNWNSWNNWNRAYFNYLGPPRIEIIEIGPRSIISIIEMGGLGWSQVKIAEISIILGPPELK